MIGNSETDTLPVAPEYLSLLDAAPVIAALISGPQHRLLYVNQRLSDLTGGRNLRGRPLGEALPELRQLLPVLNRLRKAHISGNLNQQSFRWETPEQVDGDPWHLDWYLQALDNGEQLIGLYAQSLTGNSRAGPAWLYARDLKRMVELSSSLFVVAGTDGLYRRLSPSFTSLLGWEKEDLLGRSVLDMVLPEDRERTQAELGRLVEGNDTSAFQNRLRHKNGGYRWISWTATPLPEEGAIYATGRDITDSKRANDLLRIQARDDAFRVELADAIRPLESAAEIERIAARIIARHFACQRANFATVLPDGDTVRVEQEYAPGLPSALGSHPIGRYGRSLAKASSNTIVMNDTSTDARLSEIEREAYGSLKLGAMVAVRLRRRGRLAAVLTLADIRPRRWRESEVALLSEAAERAWSAIEHAEAEAALRKSEELFRLIGDATNDVLWDWSPRTNKLEWNDALTSQLGYQREELPDIHSWRKLIHPADRKRVQARFFEDLEKGHTTWEDEYRFRRKDGSYAILLDRGMIARDRTGEPYRMLGSMLDLTERRSAEEALREANVQLIESDRRKDEFLAMLAHELRNPLAAVNNAVELLEGSARDSKSQHFLEILERQTNTLRNLVDDLLDVSRVTRGLITLNEETVNLLEVSERALESVRPLLQEKHHHLQLELPQRSVWVQGDPVRLEQVVVNLVTNAAKYTDPGGRITVSVGSRGASAELRVSDSGIGIAAEMQERIFTLFGQAERGLDRAQGGLGIGLTIVKTLVELHGGRVAVQSEGLGHGAEFVVSLPEIRPRDSFLDASEAEAADALAGKRILVVEDSPDIAETMCLLLEEAGHQVASAANGPAALEKAQTLKPDLILLDIGLPGMDGYEVARRLRQSPQNQEAVLAALTGYGQESDRSLARAAGFDAHFVKPVDFATLRAFIDTSVRAH